MASGRCSWRLRPQHSKLGRDVGVRRQVSTGKGYSHEACLNLPPYRNPEEADDDYDGSRMKGGWIVAIYIERPAVFAKMCGLMIGADLLFAARKQC